MREMTLDEVRAYLLQRGISASLRGADAAEFVFAERSGKAIELSRHRNQWWAEFWEAADDEDSPPTKEAYFRSSAEALDAILTWLLC